MEPIADPEDVAAFEAERPHLLALAYRMLGDLGRAEELVQEAWLRWSGRTDREIVSPRAFLVTTISRLCLTELSSSRRVKEESRPTRLPEPVDLSASGLERLERFEDVSMAFLVLLQRLTPAERAVWVLHDVFDFTHGEIAALLGKSEPATRKLLARAKEAIALEKRTLVVPREAHARLLRAFVAAVQAGDVDGLLALLVDDVELVTDGGPEGRRFAGATSLGGPLVGKEKVAAFLLTTARRGATLLSLEPHDLNGLPALILRLDGATFSAVQVGTDGQKIRHVWFHGDSARLGHLGSG